MLLLCLFLWRLRFSAACPAAGYPSGVPQLFWLQLPVLILQWSYVVGFAVSGCVAWFSTWCRALPPGPAVGAAYPACRLPLRVAAFSDTVCLTYCCAGGVGWEATLPLCCLCFSCTGWLAGVRWVLHPVSGCSHRGCDYSLDDSVVVLFDSYLPLGLCLLFCRLLLRFSTSVGAVRFPACFPLP